MISSAGAFITVVSRSSTVNFKGELIMARTETIRDAAYRNISIITYEDNGDIKVQDWSSRRIVGYYRKSRDVTTDFYGRIIARGNAVGMLIGRKE